MLSSLFRERLLHWLQAWSLSANDREPLLKSELDSKRATAEAPLKLDLSDPGLTFTYEVSQRVRSVDDEQRNNG